MSLIMITFIFKLESRPNKLFYGKYYTDTITPDHEGIDLEIKPYLLKGICENHKREQIQKRVNPQHFSEFKENVPIGIISVSSLKHISIHSSNEEINCFDFYCEKFTINHTIWLKMYMFGKLIENVTL
jgi:hypothetical protein